VPLMPMNVTKHSIVENRTSYKVHLKLTINHFSRRDLGTYMCVSTNSLGHADGTVRLYVNTRIHSHKKACDRQRIGIYVGIALSHQRIYYAIGPHCTFESSDYIQIRNMIIFGR
ncbi:hypothetical protein L9F63_017251, partial [Diploptera punctata]